MVLKNKICPICETNLDTENVNRKEWLDDKPVKLDHAGRAICKKCADWLENTEWD